MLGDTREGCTQLRSFYCIFLIQHSQDLLFLLFAASLPVCNLNMYFMCVLPTISEYKSGCMQYVTFIRYFQFRCFLLRQQYGEEHLVSLSQTVLASHLRTVVVAGRPLLAQRHQSAAGRRRLQRHETQVPQSARGDVILLEIFQMTVRVHVQYFSDSPAHSSRRLRERYTTRENIEAFSRKNSTNRCKKKFFIF